MTKGALVCTECGACCATSGEVQVHDHEPVPSDMTRRVRAHINGTPLGTVVDMTIMKRKINGECVALRGTIGVDCACSIYDERPNLCRVFEVGSDACIEARIRARKLSLL